MNKPCYMCPCKPTTPKIHKTLVRSHMETIAVSGGFPCHEKHPNAHALSDEAVGTDGKFIHTDCAGFKLWGLI